MATLKRIWLALNPQEAAAWQALLTTAGLAADRQVDYTVGILKEKRYWQLVRFPVTSSRKWQLHQQPSMKTCWHR